MGQANKDACLALANILHLYCFDLTRIVFHPDSNSSSKSKSNNKQHPLKHRQRPRSFDLETCMYYMQAVMLHICMYATI